MANDLLFKQAGGRLFPDMSEIWHVSESFLKHYQYIKVSNSVQHLTDCLIFMGDLDLADATECDWRIRDMEVTENKWCFRSEI